MYVATEAKQLAGGAARLDGIARLDLQDGAACRVALGTVHEDTYHDVGSPVSHCHSLTNCSRMRADCCLLKVRNHLVTPMKAQRRFGGPFCFVNTAGEAAGSILPLLLPSLRTVRYLLQQRAGEEGGLLAGFVYDEPTADSEFVVYAACALKLNDRPLVRIILPQRVPYGRACAFLDEAAFSAQFPFDFHFMDPEKA